MDPARVLANRYRLEATIGQGGMGVVHRAIDQELERAVAVKLLSQGHDPLAFDRFVVEAKRTAAVRHPCIVEVFDVGRDGDDAFLVMELLEGETLEKRLTSTPPPSPAQTVAIAGQICDALTVAHDAGLVHRDLKPANVFLVRTTDGSLRVKLLDFGIAKRIDGATARTDPSVIVGTLEYISPEQIRGVEIDGRADLYALGMTLYHVLSGVLPFNGDNVAALIHQHLSVAPMPLRERAPDRAIPVALDRAILKLLAKEPAERPASANDAKRELIASLDAGALPPTEQAIPAPPSPAKPPLATSPDAARGTERILDFDDDAAGADAAIELDHGTTAPRVPVDVARPPAIVPISPLVPLPHEAPIQLPARAPLPAWLEPLSRVPETASKRVAGYSLFVLGVYVLFFSGSLLPCLALLLLAAFGGLSFWASRRAG